MEVMQLESCNIRYPKGCIVRMKSKPKDPFYNRPLLIVSENAIGNSRFRLAMHITSKNYPGIRINLDFKGSAEHELSVIRPNIIYTISTSMIHTIDGYMKPSIMKEVDRAMAYILGLSNDCPEYLKETNFEGWSGDSEIADPYTTIPANPHGGWTPTVNCPIEDFPSIMGGYSGETPTPTTETSDENKVSAPIAQDLPKPNTQEEIVYQRSFTSSKSPTGRIDSISYSRYANVKATTKYGGWESHYIKLTEEDAINVITGNLGKGDTLNGREIKADIDIYQIRKMVHDKFDIERTTEMAIASMKGREKFFDYMSDLEKAKVLFYGDLTKIEMTDSFYDIRLKRFSQKYPINYKRIARLAFENKDRIKAILD